MKRFQNIAFAALSLFLSASVVSHAQTAPAGVGLFADQISYDPDAKSLIATGNVRVIYNDQVLTTDRVIYNQATGELTLPAAFELVSDDGTVVTGTSATLDDKATRGLITGAQILINDQFQMAASDFSRSQGRYKVMQQVVASTCNICYDNKVPFWQIRSKRVVHDEQERRIHFENPSLRLLGVPVLYLPYLSTPDPTVSRATGFLIPSFRHSSNLGYRVDLPYYIAIDDHRDATITPSIASAESFVVEGEYRHRFVNGQITANGAIALADPLSDTRFRSFATVTGDFNLRRDYQLAFKLDLSSDNTFLDQYDFNDDDRLFNFITLEKTTDDSFFSLGASFTQSLRADEVDEEIPLVFPQVYYRKNLDFDALPGRFGYTAQTVSLIRTDGSRVARVGGQLDWYNNWQFNNGLLLNAETKVEGNTYLVSNSTEYPERHYTNFTPTAAVELRYPLSKTVGNAIHVIEPIAQLVWSPDRAFDSPNEDSPQAEFSENNLFSTDRFQGFDESERGLRLNVGVNYLRYDPRGWELGVTVGRVFRQRDLNQFPDSVSAGLDGIVSDYVGAFNLRFPNQFSLSSRALFDGRGKVSKNETRFSTTYKKLDLDASYVWLDEQVVLDENDRQHEIALDARYQANQNWLFNAEWRHDLEANDATERTLGVEYENECAKIAFSVSLQNEALGKLTREFGLKISLEGLGARKSKPKFARRCGL
ncbi:LPS-assembly protein LptD [Amylibacter ulvae]|uniref:LPS-assembly protein LptD n=1 Tax=Paramylibacter ulvae TaxID=1651968 RepID=A0ABQ3CRS0_9RHOB|nr:LPS assembly protein LptD [Amylibacter ulvae]GHA40394.1 LPS-assembly protein LptD [Amylibacter ulvae]